MFVEKQTYCLSLPRFPVASPCPKHLATLLLRPSSIFAFVHDPECFNMTSYMQMEISCDPGTSLAGQNVYDVHARRPTTECAMVPVCSGAFPVEQDRAQRHHRAIADQNRAFFQADKIQDKLVTIDKTHGIIRFEMMGTSTTDGHIECDGRTLLIEDYLSSSDSEAPQKGTWLLNARKEHKKPRSHTRMKLKFGRIKEKLLSDEGSIHSRSSSSASAQSSKTPSFSSTPISTPTMARSTSDLFGVDRFHSCPGRFEPQRPTPNPSSQPVRSPNDWLQNFCLLCNTYDCRNHSLLGMMSAEAEPKSWFSDDSDDESEEPKLSWRQKVRRNRPRLDALWGVD